jgi:hypothetical protein
MMTTRVPHLLHCSPRSGCRHPCARGLDIRLAGGLGHGGPRWPACWMHQVVAGEECCHPERRTAGGLERERRESRQAAAAGYGSSRAVHGSSCGQPEGRHGGGPRWRPGLGEKPPQVIGARAEAGEEPEGAETNEGQREATCMAEASASTQRDREERGCLFLNRVEL